MDAKDFIFPGVILALVIIIGIGLLLTHSDRPTMLPTNLATSTATATSTASSTVQASVGSSTVSTSTSGTSHTPSAYYPYGSVILALGQAAAFEDGTSIRPMHVLEDSRCPMGVMCIQAGTVKLSLKVVANGHTKDETIAIGQSIEVNGDVISLDTVSPPKSQHGYPAPSEYRFTFTVKKAQ